MSKIAVRGVDCLGVTTFYNFNTKESSLLITSGDDILNRMDTSTWEGNMMLLFLTEFVIEEDHNKFKKVLRELREK